MENSSQEEEFKREVMKYWRVDFDKQMRLMETLIFFSFQVWVWKWNPPAVWLWSSSARDSESAARRKRS